MPWTATAQTPVPSQRLACALNVDAVLDLLERSIDT